MGLGALKYVLLEGQDPELKDGKPIFINLGNERCTGTP